MKRDSLQGTRLWFRRLCGMAAVICFALQVQAQDKDSVMIRKIYDEALLHGECYGNLRYLCKNIGPRLTGSAGAEKAVAYTRSLMEKTGIGKTFLQPVKVPHWERGTPESCFMTYTFPEEEKAATYGNKMLRMRKSQFRITALGMSVGTGEQGVSGQVVEVKSFEQLDSLGAAAVRGKIVFFNHPFKPTFINTFDAYGEAARYRGNAAIRAGKLGATAAVVRSMTFALDDNPHTGAMRYVDTIPKIPACAISTVGADSLSKMLKMVANYNFSFTQTCTQGEDVMSSNVIGEIKGTTHPEEVILVGGHLDSWDLAEGAHDDGAGCMQTIEVMRLFSALGYKPQRTLRFVMFMNEENGLKGGEAYAATYGKEKHVLAIETDAGGFVPRGFSSDMEDSKHRQFESYARYFKPYLTDNFDRSGGGADISPLKKLGVPVAGLIPDSQRYFDCHHSALDTFEHVNRRELELGAAALASLIYLFSEHGL